MTFNGQLGDLFRAFAELAPEDWHTQAQIAVLLGFRGPTSPVPDAAALEPPPRESLSTSANISASAVITPPTSVSREAASPVRQRLDPIDFEVPSNRGWQVVKSLPPFDPGELDRPSIHEPLFSPRRSPNLLGAALMTEAGDGPVDVALLIEFLASCKPMAGIPRLPAPSLFRGVQVLVDLGEGMEPFARDQEEILTELRRVVGADRLREMQFRHCPLRGAGSGPIWTWKPYEPPESKVPTLILSDLGMGGPVFHSDRATEAEWLAFAGRLRARSCPLIAFVPYPVDRWPSRLAKAITLVMWDRSTTVGKVRRAVSGRKRERRD